MYRDSVAVAYQDMQEGFVRNAIVAAAIGGSAMMASNFYNSAHKDVPVERVHPHKEAAENEIKSLAKTVKSKYKHVSDDFATHVAMMAKKHEKATFPKAKDILSIVGIESSFNPEAKSGLKRDPAIGLTQVRPKTWGIKPTDLDTPEKQIAKASEILHQYHNRVDGDVEKTVHAYNIGITNLKRNKGLNPSYVEKFKKERKRYD